MPSEEIDHVMNPFYRVGGMLARSHEISGIGLGQIYVRYAQCKDQHK